MIRIDAAWLATATLDMRAGPDTALGARIAAASLASCDLLIDIRLAGYGQYGIAACLPFRRAHSCPMPDASGH